MTNFFEEELRKLFGNGEVIEAPVFLGGVCAGTLDSDLRVRAEFVATAEKDAYDALLVRVVNRGGGESVAFDEGADGVIHNTKIIAEAALNMVLYFE